MGSYTKDSNFVYDLTDGKRIEHTIKKQKDKGRIKIKIQAKLLSINLVLSLFRKRKVLTKWFLVWLKGLRRWLDSLKFLKLLNLMGCYIIVIFVLDGSRCIQGEYLDCPVGDIAEDEETVTKKRKVMFMCYYKLNFLM
ncbi:uncharacterized protein [Rutidosis leptorrhynchoides]|uniref:uncharacterized protein isoform X3 n=1 Tax=Rutidosis leptorrhynchoides TaxID=125765 RepID=UPI003A9A2000